MMKCWKPKVEGDKGKGERERGAFGKTFFLTISKMASPHQQPLADLSVYITYA